ncbi:MAG: zinc ribbon domain-containing protein [Oscillospiraceae bacterium]|jgi:hypothetical protein
MDFFNKIGNKVASGASAVASKTKDLAGTTKINMQISQDEGRINTIYNEIGKRFYDLNAANPPAEYVDFFTEIAQLRHKISSAKAQIQQIKGTKICTSCGAEIPANVAFCGSCGAKAPEAPIPAVAVAPANITCPICGKIEDSSVVFCSGCGCKLK